jgi:SAM-dependent methyltransferase
MRVVDLGCGTGKLTRILHERLQARDTLGIDRSARMLESTSGHQRGGKLARWAMSLTSAMQTGGHIALIAENAGEDRKEYDGQKGQGLGDVVATQGDPSTSQQRGDRLATPAP